MHVWIDQKRCVGNGICEELCPELFDYDGDLAFVLGPDGSRLGPGATALAPVADHLADAVFEAVEACPGGCIHVTE